MSVEIGVFAPPSLDVGLAAAASASALDRPMRGRAELVVAPLSGEATLLGQFQRTGDAPAALEVFRRASGGTALLAGDGSIWTQLLLERADALTPADLPRLLNRYVRPLLRALTAAAGPTSWTGRDFLSAGRHPVAAVGAAHDRASGRVLVEALIAVAKPIWPAPKRSAFREQGPATLAETSGRVVDGARLAARLVESHLDAYGAVRRDLEVAVEAAAPCASDPPWRATVVEAIGPVAAGPDANGALRVGGELMASRDAVAALEEALAELGPGPPDRAVVGRLVDAALGGPETFTFGVRTLTSLRDVVCDALSA